jgi:hypothetical protein
MYQSFTHLTGKALSRLDEYNETLGEKLFIPRTQALTGPFMVDVQNMVVVRLCPWRKLQVLFMYKIPSRAGLKGTSLRYPPARELP